MDPRNVVLTGLPRGGTTLTCELLNTVDGVVALDEPMNRAPWMGRRSRLPFLRKRPPTFDPRSFVRDVESFFAKTRHSLIEGRGAVSLNVAGEVVGGKFVDQRTDSGLREQITKLGVIKENERLDPDFVLAVKHNAGFTVALEHLVGRFPTFAIVRNPLSTLSSWQTVKIPVNRGRVRRAELADPELKRRLDETDDVLDRQFILIEWFFGNYAKHLPPGSVIRYEDIVSSGGRVLAAITPRAEVLDAQLESRNRSAVYDRATMRRLGERLLQTGGAWHDYYSEESVRALIED